MKSMRDTNENPPGNPIVWGVPLLDEPHQFWVPTLYRTKGTDYTLGDPMQPWSWLSMLKGMQPETRERIVGPGITDICCMPIEGSYDHKRQHAARNNGKPFHPDMPVPIWDFVVLRMDGTEVRFHTSQTSKRVEIADMQRPFERDGPAAGKGKSDGRGTYRRMVASSYGEEKGAFAVQRPRWYSDKGMEEPIGWKDPDGIIYYYEDAKTWKSKGNEDAQVESGKDPAAHIWVPVGPVWVAAGSAAVAAGSSAVAAGPPAVATAPQDPPAPLASATAQSSQATWPPRPRKAPPPLPPSGHRQDAGKPPPPKPKPPPPPPPPARRKPAHRKPKPPPPPRPGLATIFEDANPVECVERRDDWDAVD